MNINSSLQFNLYISITTKNIIWINYISIVHFNRYFCSFDFENCVSDYYWTKSIRIGIKLIDEFRYFFIVWIATNCKYLP